MKKIVQIFYDLDYTIDFNLLENKYIYNLHNIIASINNFIKEQSSPSFNIFTQASNPPFNFDNSFKINNIDGILIRFHQINTKGVITNPPSSSKTTFVIDVCPIDSTNLKNLIYQSYYNSFPNTLPLQTQSEYENMQDFDYSLMLYALTTWCQTLHYKIFTNNPILFDELISNFETKQYTTLQQEELITKWISHQTTQNEIFHSHNVLNQDIKPVQLSNESFIKFKLPAVNDLSFSSINLSKTESNYQTLKENATNDKINYQKEYDSLQQKQKLN